MRFLDIATLEDAKAYLLENRVVSCEALHCIALMLGEEQRESLEAYCDELGTELVGEPGI